MIFNSRLLLWFPICSVPCRNFHEDWADYHDKDPLIVVLRYMLEDGVYRSLVRREKTDWGVYPHRLLCISRSFRTDGAVVSNYGVPIEILCYIIFKEMNGIDEISISDKQRYMLTEKYYTYRMQFKKSSVLANSIWIR